MSQDPTYDPGLVRLDYVPARVCGMVAFVSAADEDVSRLKAMGVCLGRRVEVLQTGDPLIVRVFGSRIGVSSRIARHVFLDMCGHRVAAADAPFPAAPGAAAPPRLVAYDTDGSGPKS
jgi:Fe2+ transport system protein FeoA